MSAMWCQTPRSLSRGVCGFFGQKICPTYNDREPGFMIRAQLMENPMCDVLDLIRALLGILRELLGMLRDRRRG